MGISIFLAQALCLYFVIISISLLTNGERVKMLLNKIMDNEGMLFLSGFIALIFGILLVISHNLWVMDWPVVITLVAWLALVKGIVRVVFPDKAIELSRKWLMNDKVYYASTIIILLIGLFLGFHGFF